MPSRASTPFLQYWRIFSMVDKNQVSMPFRADAPFLQENPFEENKAFDLYQCPFGLRLHFYLISISRQLDSLSKVSMPSRAGASFLRLDLTQRCVVETGINALSG